MAKQSVNREPFKRATDRKSDKTKERHKYYIKRATASCMRVDFDQVKRREGRLGLELGLV